LSYVTHVVPRQVALNRFPSFICFHLAEVVADNTSSIASITNEKPGSSQQISQKFVETATNLLNENRRASIEVSWVPGHMDIAGNDRADEIVKEATELGPATETTTIANLHRQLRDNMKVEWVTEWAKKPRTGRYAIADRIPPSLAGSHAFRTLNRHTLGVVTQAQTGHGYFREYYQTHNIQEPVSCPRDEELQTREHIVFECQTYEEHQSIIHEGAPDHQLATLFGIKAGIDALAEFVKKSKAFQKQKT